MHVTSLLDALKNIMIGLVESLGYAGLGLLALLENLVPPIPSEFVVPFAGFLAAAGRLDVGPVLAATTLGGFLGTSAFYLLGRQLGDARIRALITRYGRYVFVKAADYDTALKYFRAHDTKVVFWGRFVPGVRSLISLPAGVAGMHFGRFAAYTLLGTVLWNAALVLAGWFLGERWDLVIEVVDRLEGVLWTLLGATVIGWLIFRRRVRSRERKTRDHR
jgi:membrane protein DedA with SNARE-associated domain